MSEVKIQINSLEALERLIGGDSEFEMEVRQSVAAAFAKKHLGSKVSEMCSQQIQRDIFQGSSYTIKDEFKRKLEAEALKQSEALSRGLISAKIHDCVEKAVNKLLKDEYLNEVIERIVDSKVKTRVSEIVSKLTL